VFETAVHVIQTGKVCCWMVCGSSTKTYWTITAALLLL